ncbi:MAG: hypothetical protein R3B96_21980 [Pirellulaceae bacterium]
MAIRRIGQIFVDMGFITDEQCEMLVEEQSQNPGRLIGRIAIDMGLIDEDQLCQALAEQMNLQVIDLEGLEIPDEVIDEVSAAMAQLYKVIPLRLADNRPDGRDLRSPEPVDGGRTPTLPGLRHSDADRHRVAGAQDDRQVLQRRPRHAREAAQRS